MSQEEVASAIGVSRPTYIAVEQGKREPRPDELVALSRTLGRSVSELVRESPPVVGLAGQFRIAGSDVPDAGAAASVEELERLADDVLALETLLGANHHRSYPDVYSISGLPVAAAAEQIAEAERRRLGLGDGPIPELRDLLESDVGIRVFALPLPSRIAGLFGHAEPAGSCIAVNSLHPRERQRWTLAHEYGHFLTTRWTAEVTLLNARRSGSEALADGFAACFLMPRGGLLARFQGLVRSRSVFTAGDLLQLAYQYHVSAEALAQRLESLELLKAGWWSDLVARGLRVEEAKEQLGLPSQHGDAEVVSVRTKFLAVEACLRGLLTEGQLARLLRTDRVTARQIIRTLSEAPVMTDAGVAVSYAWEPGSDDAVG